MYSLCIIFALLPYFLAWFIPQCHICIRCLVYYRIYIQPSNISRHQIQNLNVSRMDFQLSLPELLKPGVENEDVIGATPTGWVKNRWFGTLLRSIWRHCNVVVIFPCLVLSTILYLYQVICLLPNLYHFVNMMTSCHENYLLALCERNPLVTGRFPLQRSVMRTFDGFFLVGLSELLRNSRAVGYLRRFDDHVTSL